GRVRVDQLGDARAHLDGDPDVRRRCLHQQVGLQLQRIGDVDGVEESAVVCHEQQGSLVGVER
ncbi:MAG: hypothetical protein QOE99_1415, partial [Actinomycetota bacterium]|nr:hypothetical protein [Actinomycetota bacterium]